MNETGDSASKRQWLLRSLVPRARGSGWLLLLGVVLGAAAGVGAYTFSYAKGLSYFGTDPRACVNCHIMEPQYAGWQKSSHHTVARCIDCHLPESFIPKYIAKAENGYRHGKLFTTQQFEEPITVKAAGREILQANCERCHAELVSGMLGHGSYGEGLGQAEGTRGPAQGVDCVHCHWTAGHGDRAGLGGPARGSERAGAGPQSTNTDQTHD